MSLVAKNIEALVIDTSCNRIMKGKTISGQFLPFNSSFFDTAVLKVAGKEAFKGSIGKVNKKWAFKITQNLEK